MVTLCQDRKIGQAGSAGQAKEHIKTSVNITKKAVTDTNGSHKVPTDTPTEFKFGDAAADIQRRREEREHREREKEAQNQATIEETTHSAEVGVA